MNIMYIEHLENSVLAHETCFSAIVVDRIDANDFRVRILDIHLVDTNFISVRNEQQLEIRSMLAGELPTKMKI